MALEYKIGQCVVRDRSQFEFEFAAMKLIVGFFIFTAVATPISGPMNTTYIED